jgi:quercetin dioxygenase-like cupin family protein
MAVITTWFSHTLPNGVTQWFSYNRFEKAGDEIPIHDHPHFHSASVPEGRAEVFDDEGSSIVVEPGEDLIATVEFSAQRRHGIRALVDGTITIHVSEPGFGR